MLDAHRLRVLKVTLIAVVAAMALVVAVVWFLQPFSALHSSRTGALGAEIDSPDLCRSPVVIVAMEPSAVACSTMYGGNDHD